MPVQLLVAALQIIIGALMLLGVLWVDKWIIGTSERFLPGGKVERLVVLLSTLGVTTWLLGYADVSNAMAGVIVLVGGLAMIAAYRMDDDSEVFD